MNGKLIEARYDATKIVYYDPSEPGKILLRIAVEWAPDIGRAFSALGYAVRSEKGEEVK